MIDVNSDPLRRTVKRGTNRSTGPPRSRSATHNSKPTKKLDHPHIRHKSATMTLDLYGHLFADQLDEVADAMDARAPRLKIVRTFCGLTAPMSMS